MYEQSNNPDPRLDHADFRVALVCMPFASAQRLSLQIGLITAIAEQAGFKTDAYHFNLELAAELSPAVYEPLCDHRGQMTGEWLFAPAAFGSPSAGDEDRYFGEFPDELEWARGIGKDPAFLANLRRTILPLYVDRCFEAVDWARYRVVGFSSTFQQNVACLALARRISERYPGVAIVFGGANMEGEMGPELARAFPFIDYVVVGEAEVVFPSLLHSLAKNEPIPELPGLFANTPAGLIGKGQATPTRNLDALPLPIFDSYFDQANRLGLLQQYKSSWMLPFESSRGCWWGQKHHCTFCGLNGLGMTYRAKSPQRVLAELKALSQKYRITAFSAVDNILDLKYVEQLFGELERAKVDYRFFYEVKANLTRAQLQALYRGGVRSVQPGIESMSTHVLELMRKGCTMLQNVRFLKWCRYYNISTSWNLIHGFPGESDEDYRQELDVLKRISHLEPPGGSGRIWLERFSPYYTDGQKFPVRNRRPEPSYRYVYPETVDIDRVAYFFDYEMGDTVAANTHFETAAYVSEWQKTWHSDQRHTLSYRRTADGLLIDYHWGRERSGTYTLSGPLALMYELCGETMHTVERVVQYLRDLPEGYRIFADEVRDAMDEFCRGGLMLGEDGKYLSLAIPSNPNW